MASAEYTATLVPGPWQHRFVSASGTRFHVAEMGRSKDPLVVLLHGFPQFWWTWRAILPELAAAGLRAAAVDLRGCAASDKPPSGYEVPSLARDVVGVIGCLGEEQAVVVGQGLGGAVAWASARYFPASVRGVAVLSTPSPAEALRHPRRVMTPFGRQRMRWIRALRSPERALAERGLAARILREWSATPWLDQASDVAAHYERAMQVPFAAEKSLAPLRWLGRSPRRRDLRRYIRRMSPPPAMPVLQVLGAADPLLRTGARSAAGRSPGTRTEVIPGAGHFLTEEAPTQVTDLLLDWLTTLD